MVSRRELCASNCRHACINFTDLHVYLVINIEYSSLWLNLSNYILEQGVPDRHHRPESMFDLRDDDFLGKVCIVLPCIFLPRQPPVDKFKFPQEDSTS